MTFPSNQEVHPVLRAWIDAANATIDCARELERLRGLEAKARGEWETVRRSAEET